MTIRAIDGTSGSAATKSRASRKQGETTFLLVLAAVVLAVLVASVALAPVLTPDATTGSEWTVGP
jgi:hypothetical protein